MKRILSCILVLSCLVSSVPTLAISAEDVELSTIATNVEKHLSFIYPEKENYGLGNTNFNNLWLGSPIYTYEVKDNGINPYDLRIFPILDDTNIVALALVNNDSVTLTVDKVDTFANCLSQLDSVSLIYDDSTAYICSEEELVPAWTIYNSYGIEDRAALASTPFPSNANNSDIIFSTASPIYKLELLPQTRQAPYFVNVPIIPQIINNTYYPICWACTAASIGNYLTGASYTGLYVADETYGRRAASDAESLAAIATVYDINYSYYTGVSSGIPQMIAMSLDSKEPVWSKWTCSTGTWHVTVIRSIDLTTNTFSVMDSEYTSGYLTGNYNSAGAFVYMNVENGAIMTLWAIALKQVN